MWDVPEAGADDGQTKADAEKQGADEGKSRNRQQISQRRSQSAEQGNNKEDDDVGSKDKNISGYGLEHVDGDRKRVVADKRAAIDESSAALGDAHGNKPPRHETGSEVRYERLQRLIEDGSVNNRQAADQNA